MWGHWKTEPSSKFTHTKSFTWLMGSKLLISFGPLALHPSSADGEKDWKEIYQWPMASHEGALSATMECISSLLHRAPWVDMDLSKFLYTTKIRLTPFLHFSWVGLIYFFKEPAQQFCRMKYDSWCKTEGYYVGKCHQQMRCWDSSYLL